MRHVGVSEDNLVDVELLDQFGQLAFGVDRDAFRVKLSSQFFRIQAAFDVGDLRGGESYHFVILVTAEEGVEVVEVTPGGPHDDSADWHKGFSLLRLDWITRYIKAKCVRLFESYAFRNLT